jgi:hypothetical protein
MTLSTNGRLIIYTKKTGTAAEVWRYDSFGAQYGGEATHCVSCADNIHGTNPALSQDGSQMALVSPTGALLMWPQYLAQGARVVSGVAGVAEPSWLRDGSGVVVASPAGGPLRRVTLSGSDFATGKVNSLVGTDGARNPTVSPDNTRVAYLAVVPSGRAVRIVPLNGGAVTSVLSGPELRGVSWSPDGKSLVVTRGAGAGGSEVVSVDVATGAVTTVFTSAYRLESALLRQFDATPPRIAFSGPATTNLSPRIGFTVTDDVTPSGGMTLQCALDNLGAGKCGPTSWSGSVSPGTHTLTVTAWDGTGGNWATATYRFTAVTPPPDRTAPVTTVTSKRFSKTADHTPTFTFVSNEAHSRFQCRVDTGKWRTCASPFTTKRLAKGKHTFRVRAFDPAGNVDRTPEVREFRVR